MNRRIGLTRLYGPCCLCETEGPQVRNFVMLSHLAPQPGTGWGCFVCNLPQDGALAVICHRCRVKIEADPNQIHVRFVIDGLPSGHGRAPIESVRDTHFDHDISKHPELQEQIQ